MSRVDGEPALILHRRAWRDSSLILEMFTPGFGRIAAVARAARTLRSTFFGLTEPFRALEASWTRRGEMATLTGLDPDGPPVRLAGRALWCGLYANELLMKLLPRDLAEPALFGHYRQLLAELARGTGQALALRRFELALVTALGIAPDLSVCAQTGQPVRAGQRYRLDPVVGLVPPAGAGAGVDGAALRALLEGHAIPPGEHAALRAMMRQLIDHQLDGRKLSTPELFRELPR